jgi:hypothetical protein
VQAVYAGREFDAAKYREQLLQLEQKWNRENTTYPTTPTGNTLQVAYKLAAKYHYPLATMSCIAPRACVSCRVVLCVSCVVV